jgi:dUTPase
MNININIMSFKNNNTHLLNIYDKVMVLKLFIDSEDNNLKNMYYAAVERHNQNLQLNQSHIDVGFDLFAPRNENNEGVLHFFGTGGGDKKSINKLDYKVCCSARMVTDTGKKFNTGYYMYPRSSLSKTPLRLANSVGIIDAGYRGHLIGMFDVVNETLDYYGKQFDRYLQICAPGLVPIFVEIVNTFNELSDETERGAGCAGCAGGFGFTGL